MENKFLFSVIIPVLNSEEIVANAVDSVINQTIGFEKNIQIILVDGGSADATVDICKAYKEKYPENICLELSSEGNPNNAGLKRSEGKYVTFLDVTDMWQEDAFKMAYDYFEEHYDEIDVLAARIKCAGDVEKYHILDFKFAKGTRLVDVEDQDDCQLIQSKSASAFVKREALDDLEFADLFYGADTLFINKLILKKKTYGLLKESVYLLGKSNICNPHVEKEYYLSYLDEFHMELINYSKALYGCVPAYAQAVVVYNLMSRFGEKKYKELLDEAEQQDYLKKARAILQEIDDMIIVKNRVHVTVATREYAYRIKHGKELCHQLQVKDNRLCFGEEAFFSPKYTKVQIFKINKLELQDHKLAIEVYVAGWLLRCTRYGKVQVAFLCGDQIVLPELTEHDPNGDAKKSGKPCYYHKGTAVIDLKNMKKHRQLTVYPSLTLGSIKIDFNLSYADDVKGVVVDEKGYDLADKYIIRCHNDKITVDLSTNALLQELEA